jgi:hypothetical protein
MPLAIAGREIAEPYFCQAVFSWQRVLLLKRKRHHV